MGGVSLVLMETLTEFGAVQFFGVDTFTTVFTAPGLAWASDCRGPASRLPADLRDRLVLLERWSRGKRRYFHTTNRYQSCLSTGCRWHAAGATLACLLPITVGFLLPSGILLEMAMTTGDSLFGTRFIGFAMNSLSLATVAALIAVGLAVL